MIRPHGYWMLTRRTLNRMFLLLPDDWVRLLFMYALARACALTGVELIGGVVMSTHYHLIVYDALGQVPRFARLLDELVARAGNAQRERRDYFWESKGLKYTCLRTREAVEQELVYALTNPQKDGLVRRSGAWPGWLSRVGSLGTTTLVERPSLVFITADTTLPGSFELCLSVPRTHADMSAAEFRAHIGWLMTKREKELDVARGDKPYLGVARVMASDPSDTATKEEPLVSPVPAVAVGGIEHAREVLAEYRQAVKLFRALYRAAYGALRAGKRYCFPWGTYYWKVFGNLSTAEAPACG